MRSYFGTTRRRGRRYLSMRINPYIQVQQVYNNTKVGKTQKAGAVARTDGLEISRFGRDIQTAKAAIAEAPDVRSDAVAKAKADLENGTLTGESFADKLLAAYEAREGICNTQKSGYPILQTADLSRKRGITRGESHGESGKYSGQREQGI